MPRLLFRLLKASKKWWLNQVADRLYFPIWLAWQCLRNRRRVIVLHRIGVLGDVLCTLPMVDEIRRRHPGQPLVYVVASVYKRMVQMSHGLDAIYGACSWAFVPPPHGWGVIEKVYSPKTTDELSKITGPTRHLIDDLATSCGITLTNRQPHLYPSKSFIVRTLSAQGLATDTQHNSRLIAINGGHSWPVKEWGFDKWQLLVDKIHAEYNATILLFGVSLKPQQPHEYARLKGVESFVNHRVPADEMVALIAACHLVISIDSGPVHIAGAVGTPVVGLYGANSPMFRLPPASPGIGLVANVPCLYCHHTTPRGHWITGCPHDIRCMKELEVDAVFKAVKTMLKNQSLEKKPA